LGNLSSKRDYIFVDDVAEALLRLAQYGRDGRSATVNIGSGRTYAGHEIVDTLAGFTPSGTGVVPAVDPDRLRGVDRPVLLADTTLAQKLLDWTPRTGLLDGLRAAWDRPVGAGVRIS
ncbi:MAG: GDP-mannose 4,6-dehydratase, partial [Trebonia sp.]